MISYERKERILSYLEQNKSASVRELAQAVFVSEATVRRDIEALAREGSVQTIYGGVLLARYRNGVVPLSLRDAEHSAAKEEIAMRAAKLIRDGDTVMMDASSTVRRMLKHLGNRKNVKIITNNQRIFSEYEGGDLRLWCVGGTYVPENHAFVGPAAEQFLQSVSADLLFFSSQGITEDGIISDASEAENSLRRIMLTRATKQYFLCDSSKIGVRRMFTLCQKDDITAVLCNQPLPWEEG